MSDELKQGVVSQVSHAVVEAVATNPKVQMTIATGTTAVGIDLGLIQYLQIYVAFIVAILGGLLTLLLIIKTTIDIVRNSKEYKYKVSHRDD